MSMILQAWSKRSTVQRSIFLFMAIAPSLLGYMIFTLYPNILSVYYSLLRWDGISQPKFVGLQNYIYLVQDSFVWQALWNNVVYLLVVPVLTLIISLLIAYLLSSKGFGEAGVYKVLFFTPNVLSIVLIALLWGFVYDGDYGILNHLLLLFGIDVNGFYWLGDSATAF